MTKKGEKDQGSHTDEKKSVKPVVSDVTKELIEGDKVTEALNEQVRVQAEEKAIEDAKKSKGATFEATLGSNHSKASFEELLKRYAKENPVKYALKKARLEAKLSSLK